ncbi:Amidohydrolase 2 [Oopsacas minuta]|uniref:Amidohydrolase 2 n=1 Tax=Oopsacas minuta TaxID=111878 RepID=A0AAV7K8T8_9METZ|nr:Amidohydrolase 2 [Oopsacas minuta]
MAEANPASSLPTTSEITTARPAYDVAFLDDLLTEDESGKVIAGKTGTAATIDSQALDAVVSEMCEFPEKKYAYLTNPPVAKRGPISSFCNFVGGRFNREPEHMVDTRTGLVTLSPTAQRIIRTCFTDISPEEIVDYHTHIIGHGEDTSGSTGCYLHPAMKSWKHPTQHLKGLVFLSACQVADKHLGDLQFISRLLRLNTNFVPSALLPVPSPYTFRHGHNCILAFDKLYTLAGEEDLAHTSLYVPNNYVLELAKDSPGSFYPVGSVHPYRADAIAELERCSSQGISIIKWLPNSQGIDPSSELCDPFYNKMVQLNLTLLIHTGYEHAVNFAYLNNAYGNPLLLRRPLNMGVRVIAAHVATEGSSEDTESVPPKNVPCFDLLLRLMREEQYKQTLFADISAITGFKRIPYLHRLLAATDIHSNLVYGSDYPIPAINIVVSVSKIVNAGLLTYQDGVCLKEIYNYNPLLFDFILKRRLTGENSQRFPVSVFKKHSKIPPFRPF